MYWKYLKSLLRHKWFVFVECCKMRMPVAGLLHDWSKFLPDEFVPYARYFYGGETTKSVDRDFSLAWLKHQKRNKHHWQWWVLRLDSPDSGGPWVDLHKHGDFVVFPMPDRYCKEMLADWYGAGRAYGNPDTANWFLENYENMILHDSTLAWVAWQLCGDSVLGWKLHRTDGSSKIVISKKEPDFD